MKSTDLKKQGYSQQRLKSMAVILLSLGVAFISSSLLSSPVVARQFYQKNDPPTTWGFGIQSPVGSNFVHSYPLLNYHSSSTFFKGVFKIDAKIKNHKASAELHYKPKDYFAFKLKSEAAKFVAYDGVHLFLLSTWQDTSTFLSDQITNSIYIGQDYGANSEIYFGMSYERNWFDVTELTSSTFTLPSNFVRTTYIADFKFKDIFSQSNDAYIHLKVFLSNRNNWDDWSLEDDYTSKADYAKYETTISLPVNWNSSSYSEFKFYFLNGSSLDILSSFGIGGYSGQYRLVAFYQNEYRSARAFVSNMDYTINLNQTWTLLGMLDLGYIEEIKLNYLSNTVFSHSTGSFGLGVQVKMGWFDNSYAKLLATKAYQNSVRLTDKNRGEIIFELKTIL